MDMSPFAFLLFLVAFADASVEGDLRKKLLTGYSTSNGPETVTIKKMSPCTQTKISEEESSLIAYFVIEMSWNDDRLKWTPAANGNIETMTFASTEIWTPIFGSEGTEFASEAPKVTVSSTGDISFSGKLTIHQHLDLSPYAFFPFDTYKVEEDALSLVEATWATSFSESGNPGSMTVNHEFTICSYGISTTEGGSELKWSLKLKRNSLYNAFDSYLPSILSAILTCTTFILPVDGAMPGYALATLLLYSVFMLLFSHKPKHLMDTLPILHGYYYMQVILCFLGVCAAIYLLRLSRRTGECCCPLAKRFGKGKDKKDEDGEEKAETNWKDVANKRRCLLLWVFIALHVFFHLLLILVSAFGSN